MNSTWSNSAVNKDKCNKIREPNQIASKKINSKFYYLNFEPEKKKKLFVAQNVREIKYLHCSSENINSHE